jgi:uncharacterized protein with ParB-like and HNH nuclease domain
MEAKHSSIASFLSAAKTQFIIPVYQRPYDWRKEQCKQLLADVVAIGGDAAAHSHFVGSIVYMQTSLVTSPTFLTIIDGQQRLTTLTLLWAALHKRALEAGSDELAAEIYDTFLTNKYLKGAEKLKLKPIKKDDAALQHIIGTDGSTAFQGFSRLVENFNFLYDSITPDLASTVKTGLEKLVFIEIALEYGKDDPQKIFQSLNSTGLALSQADLIRNYVLMDLPPEEQESIYEQYWRHIEAFTIEQTTQNSRLSDFIRDYLTFTFREIPNQNGVFAAFKEKFVFNDEGNINTTPKADLKSVLGALKMYAGYYNALINPAAEARPRLAAHLRFINKLAVTVAYPFLLEVYHDYATKRISEATLEGVLAMIQSYVWRRFLCNVPTNALNKVFALLYKDIANASTEAEYRRLLEQALMRRRTNQRFPNDWEVQEALNTRDMYNIQPKNRMYFLERMENHGHPIPTHVEGNPNVSVEHIFPQRAGDVWRRELGAQRFEQMQKLLHTAANLTLTALEYNASMGNRSFTEKRDMPERGYKASNLRLDKFLAALTEWTPETLVKRGEWMFERFKEIWPCPQVSIDAFSDDEQEVNILDLDPSAATNRALEYATFFDTTLHEPSFRDVYRLVTQIMFEREPHVFLSAAFQKRLTVSSEATSFATPMNISERYFMDGNVSARAAVTRIQFVLDQCETDDELMLKFLRR